MSVFERRRGPYVLSTDPARLDLEVVHGFLTACYWAKGIPREVVARSMRDSLRFGVYEWDRQVGFCRVITDRATFAYLADVFVLESHRGRGLSKWMMGCVTAHPELQGLRRWVLGTRDAHGLYRQFGFRPLADAGMWMEVHDPAVYGDPEEAQQHAV